LLAPTDGWENRGRDHLRPSSRWLSAVIGSAIAEVSGLAFVHSHPGHGHPPELSGLDKSTSIDWAASLTPRLDGPFLSLVWTPDGLSGWVFESEDPSVHWNLSKAQVLGGRRLVTLRGMSDVSSTQEIDDRQIRALGELGNRKLQDLTVAVVGVGGTGSPLAEQLARVGVRELILVDPDRVDTPSNLRRITGSRPEDLTQGVPKVDVVTRHLTEAGLGTVIHPVHSDIRYEEAARRVLDADVVISTTDTHSSRSLINQLAQQYLLPVIDVGVKIGTALDGRVTGMPTEVRLLLPDTGCMWCIGVLDSARIRAENLPMEERRNQVAEGYIQGVDQPEASLAALNYFASSLAVLTLVRLLSTEGVVASHAIMDGWEHYVADRTSDIDAQCICRTWRSMGDLKQMPFLPSSPT
jgi:hypothetical protein